MFKRLMISRVSFLSPLLCTPMARLRQTQCLAAIILLDTRAAILYRAAYHTQSCLAYTELLYIYTELLIIHRAAIHIQGAYHIHRPDIHIQGAAIHKHRAAIHIHTQSCYTYTQSCYTNTQSSITNTGLLVIYITEFHTRICTVTKT